MSSDISAVRSKKTKKEQFLLESVILEYQDAIEKNNLALIDKIYNRIIEIYPAMNYVGVWMKKYIYLYDSSDDFLQDYLRIFCTSLVNWKPKHLRKKSRYNGSGDFKNYFWSSLQNNYINMVKAENSGKRSVSSKCPICDKWCSSLSTHLLQEHTDVLWNFLDEKGFDTNNIKGCPFCQTFKISPKLASNLSKEMLQNKLKKHIISMHSNYLFDYFKEEFPGCINSSKPTSVYICEHDEEGELNMYDVVRQYSSVDDLLDCSLTSIQEEIIAKIFNHRNKNYTIVYSPKLYNCSKEQFQQEIDDLRQKMFLCGIDGGKDK